MVVTRIGRAVVVLGAVAVAFGVAGLAAADGSFTDRAGWLVGRPSIELALAGFNRLGAMCTLALGVVAVVAGWRRSVLGVGIAAAGFAVMALQVVVQWGRGANVLGGRGSNLSLWGGLAIGLATLAWAMRTNADERDPA
ncbi:MAG: hypothetical protein SGJ13_00190 [Actinomycetota bacterium]|nr:hypothetical protein [Actinomycetota bacterium]